MKSKNLPSLLFEIGVEEIPSGYFTNAKLSILEKAPALLAECGWGYDKLEVETTPRRFVICADCFRRLPVQYEEKLGPLKEEAYRDGKPTPTMKGFLKSVGQTEEDVTFKEMPRGLRVSVKIKKAYKPLRYFFETLPRGIKFPKLMRWEATRYPFSRPIRWMFALVGKERQKFRIGDVESGDLTMGHRFLAPKKVKVRQADLNEFKHLLSKHHVILSVDERMRKIKESLQSISEEEEELIQTVAHLVEEPFAVCGSFNREYLKLPSAVLTTCMTKYQRIFAQHDSSGRLTNRFIAFINGRRKDTKLIAKNYESVLRSRLEDARFFFQEDQKTKLEFKVSVLREMIFLGSLGSYYDKTKRLEALSQILGEEIGFSRDEIQWVKRAAFLSKADLSTRLVYEFPELQGIAGSEYARLDGEEKNVAGAIAEYYFPVNLSQNYHMLKKQLSCGGALLGICDRIDLLVGALSLGIEISSSEDPYALRRAAGGIVKIVRAHGFKFSLRKLIGSARDQYGNLISKKHVELAEQLLPFFNERISYELGARAGTKEFELLQGILATDSDYMSEVYEKFDALTGDLDHSSFIRACKVMERTSNILRGIKGKTKDDVEPELFENPLEKNLFDLINHEEPEIQKLVHGKEYRSATRRYGDVFYQPIHDFFDQVMVNTEDPKIRANRQALMKKVNQICARQVADLSRVSAS